jgi:hypothetical protein
MPKGVPGPDIRIMRRFPPYSGSTLTAGFAAADCAGFCAGLDVICLSDAAWTHVRMRKSVRISMAMTVQKLLADPLMNISTPFSSIFYIIRIIAGSLMVVKRDYIIHGRHFEIEYNVPDVLLAGA